jgi:epoxyqueuosine reductase
MPDTFLKDQLRNFCFSRGAEVFGVAATPEIRDEFDLSPEVVERFDKAICLGVGLSAAVLAGIDQQPTKLYYHHYRTANAFLDQLAFGVSRWIEERGRAALPVPASQVTDWEKQTAHVSHKKIGFKAGIGWIGRNNLLVSKKLGSQMRLVTVLTDLPVEEDRPVEEDCGACRVCIAVCPAHAIQERPEDFRHMDCFEKCKSFQRHGIVGQFVCGVCVKACEKKRS